MGSRDEQFNSERSDLISAIMRHPNPEGPEVHEMRDRLRVVASVLQGIESDTSYHTKGGGKYDRSLIYPSSNRKSNGYTNINDFANQVHQMD